MDNIKKDSVEVLGKNLAKKFDEVFLEAIKKCKPGLGKELEKAYKSEPKDIAFIKDELNNRIEAKEFPDGTIIYYLDETQILMALPPEFESHYSAENAKLEGKQKYKILV